MKTSEFLAAARKKITRWRDWHSLRWASTGGFFPTSVSPRDPRAKAFCALGALDSMRGLDPDTHEPHRRAEQLLNSVCIELYGTSVISLNYRSHRKILEAFDIAAFTARQLGD